MASATGAVASWPPRVNSAFSGDGTLRDSGALDVVAPSAPQQAIEELPDETIVFLLGSRYCETDRLSETAWNLFGNARRRLGARPGDLRFRPSPHSVRLRACPRHQDRVGGLPGAPRRVP